MTLDASLNLASPEAHDFAADCRGVATVLAAADELAAASDVDTLFRRGVELARERVGLERVALYLRDPGAPSILLRGTWGTSMHGEIVDERGICHECSPADYQELCQMQRHGALWAYHDPAPAAAESSRQAGTRRRWLVVTPLVHAGEAVGVMYNDAALTNEPVDETKQARAAVFCSLLAILVSARRGARAWRPSPRRAKPGLVVERALALLNQDPQRSGERLAGEIGVSPGHLARSFKLEMGMSLVDYRNRLRMQRYFESMRENGDGGLERAARKAGFGSYAQFHRVHHKLFGTAPRDYFAPPSSRGDDAGY